MKLARLRELRELTLEAQRRERARLANVDVFGLLEYTPTPKQELFHSATEYDVLFGGAAGGGKTRALLMECVRACVRHPGLRVGAFRRSYPELRESLLAELAQAGFAQALGAVWHGGEYELRFPNGSVVMFRYAESLKDATRRQGGQYQLLVFDERTLMAPDVITFLESRLRSGRAEVPVLGIRSTSNPGGVGHGAVRARYIDPTEYGQKVVTDVRGRQVRFIPSRLSDNPHVNPEYSADLKALPDGLREAFLLGNWDVFAGAMFPGLDRDRHVVDPIEIPATWTRYNGIDWGYSNPWCVLWAAVDEDDRVWVYREVYARQVGEADQAAQILAAEASSVTAGGADGEADQAAQADDQTAGEHIAVRWADDAMWATRGDAKPLAQVYADNGVYLTPAGKGAGSRVHGWQRVRTYLADGPACPHHRARGWETCPRIHLLAGAAENLYRELRDLPHATTGDPEDADSKADDHAADALRYMLINLGGGAQFPILDTPTAGDEVQVAPSGQFAYRAGPELPFPTGSDDPHGDDVSPGRGRVRRSPWA